VTIRDYVKQRTRWALGVAALAWLTVMALLSVPSISKSRDWPAWFLPCGAVMFLAIQAPKLIKCPRCFRRFGDTANRIGVPLWRATINFCPHCGVSLDEPMPDGS
jgi:hypothetical protein